MRTIPSAAPIRMTTAPPSPSLPDGPIDLRAPDEAHWPAILEIYAHYVLNDTCTFEETVPSLDEMRAREHTLGTARQPLFLVATVGDAVAGYAYAAPYRARPAYRHTVENSVYVARGWQGRGIGSALLGRLIERCTQAGLAQMVAVIGDSANAGSIALHERLGFTHAGTLRRVGFKFGRWIDTVLMQRALQDGPQP